MSVRLADIDAKILKINQNFKVTELHDRVNQIVSKLDTIDHFQSKENADHVILLETRIASMEILFFRITPSDFDSIDKLSQQ